MPAGVGGGDCISERPLGDHHIPGPAGGVGAGQRTSGKDQFVVLVKRFYLRINFGKEVSSAEAASAHIVPRPVFSQRLFGDLLGGQIDPQHRSGPAVHHGLPPSCMVWTPALTRWCQDASQSGCSRSTYSMASVGQALAHAGSPPQRSHLKALWVSGL